MIIIRGDNTGPSARALKADLTRRGERAIIRRDGGYDFAINWSGTPQAAEINARTSSNKLRQLQRWKDEGLSCPDFTQSIDGAMMGWLPRTLYHRQGRDFDRAVMPDFYVEPVTNVKREWRLHMFLDGANYRCGRIGRKVKVDDVPDHTPVPIRNRRFGWRLKYYATTEPWIHKLPRSFNYGEAVTQSGWALHALDWDMGAVDLLECTDGTVMLLEANSCPGLNDAPTAAVYGDYVQRRYNGRSLR